MDTKDSEFLQKKVRVCVCLMDTIYDHGWTAPYGKTSFPLSSLVGSRHYFLDLVTAPWPFSSQLQETCEEQERKTRDDGV
jgi:hypothetical protein